MDYNATTPLDPGVRQAMLPYLDEVYGNPSSVHRVGQQARAALDSAREKVAQVWKCKPTEVVFTSGGTESVNLALLGVARKLGHRGRHIITSPIEHPAVLHTLRSLVEREGFRISYLPVDGDGIVAVSELDRLIDADTILVSVMAANNEIGTVQPVADIGSICHQHGVLFHTDAVQWFGKAPFESIHQFQADLVSFCAHKLHGPKGAGALFVRSPLVLEPLLRGGGHENERRAGTENLAGIVGLSETTARFVSPPIFAANPVPELSGALVDMVDRLDGAHLRGSRSARLCNTVSFTVNDCDSLSLVAGLDLEGFCVSSGSACTSGSLQPSHVLQAMGVPSDRAGFVRFSLGRENSWPEIELLREVLPRVINRIRRSA